MFRVDLNNMMILNNYVQSGFKRYDDLMFRVDLNDMMILCSEWI